MGWIGVDLDGTLARSDPLIPTDMIGEPIYPMVQRVKQWLNEGEDVRIFTARAADIGYWEIEQINAWCLVVFNQILPVTCVKDWDCIEIWDDIAVSIEHNTGRIIGDDFL